MAYRLADAMVVLNRFGAVFCQRRQMRRRELLAFMGAAAAWPLAAHAQQSANPTIGFLGSESADAWAPRLSEFRRGLSELGYVEGQNLTVAYRWAEGHNERLPSMAADLAAQQVKAIVAPGSTPAALAGRIRPRRQPEPTRRQYHRHHDIEFGNKRETSRTPAQPGARQQRS